jgi:hypothetical protein
LIGELRKPSASLLDEFVRVRDAEYRNAPDEAAARMDSIEYTIQAILEKLRDDEGLA